jgi:hypothetical protein
MECDKMALKNKIHFDIDTLESIAGTQGQAINTLEGQASSSDDHIAATNNPHQVTAAQVGAVTPGQLTNAITAVVEDLDWKEMVPTFADLAIEYPEPDQGWTASVAADNITYRYNGTEWVPILGALSPLATMNNNGLISKEDFTKLLGIETFAKDDQSAAEVPFDNQETNLNSSSVQGALEELDFKKLDATALATTLAFYSTDAPSDILAPSFRLVTSISDPDYPVSPVNINTPAISGQNQVVGQLVSDPGVILGNPGVITINTIGQIRKISGNANQQAAFYYEVYRYDGVLEQLETEPTATSNVTPAVTSTAYEQFFASAVFNNGVFGPLDRIVVRYYANQVQNSGAVYQFQFGGDNPVRTLFPVPVEVIPAPDASKIFVDTGDFDGLLDGNDNTVQQALDTLDDHNHDPIYFRKNQLRPLAIDPEDPQSLIEDFETTAQLDGRYATQPDVDEIIGGVNPENINLGSLDGRVSTLESLPTPTGGGELLVYEATLNENDWAPSFIGGDWVSTTLNLTPESNFEYRPTVGALGFPVPENNIGNESDLFSDTQLPATTFTLSSTSTTGPITLTKPTGTSPFNQRWIGVQLFFGENNFERVAAYVVTEVIDDDTLTIYWNTDQELTETVFLHNQEGPNIVFVDFLKIFQDGAGNRAWTVGNFVNQLDFFLTNHPIVNRLTYSAYNFDTQEWVGFDIPSGKQLELVQTIEPANGTTYFAVIIDDEAFVAKEEGIRKVAFRNAQNEIFVNVAPNFLDESFILVASGADVHQINRVAAQAIAAQSFIRATNSDWAAASELPDTTNASKISFALGVQAVNQNTSADFFGMQLEFVGDAPLDANDRVLVDLLLNNEYFQNNQLIDAEWSKVKGVQTLSNGSLNFVASEAPITSFDIKIGVIK